MSHNRPDVEAADVGPTNRAARLPRTARRAQLLAAAQDVFAANGYHAAAMDEIAERAGVSKPVLYQHFPGKLELYLALLEMHVDELIMRITDAMESTSDNEDRVRNAVSVFFDFVDGEDQTYRLVVESDLRGEPAVQAALDRGTDACVAAITATITADAGLDGGLARLLAVGLVGISQVAARSWLAKNRTISKEEAVGLISTLAWKGIGGGFPLVQVVSDDRPSFFGKDKTKRSLELVQPYVPSGAEGGWSSDTIPVAIYLESTASAQAVERAALEVLHAAGFAIDEMKPPIVGSWFRLMRIRPNAAGEVADILARIERALEMQLLHKPQAEIDSALTDGLAKLIVALANDRNAFVQIGSVLLVKVDGVVVVRNLTQRELSFLQRNSGSLVSPRAILQALEEFVIDDEHILRRHAAPEEGLAVEQGSVKVVVRRPDDHGTVSIELHNGHGLTSNYDVIFGAPNGTRQVRAASKNTAHVEPGPDGVALLHSSTPTLIVKRPDRFPREIEMTLDCGDGPTTYLLHFI